MAKLMLCDMGPCFMNYAPVPVLVPLQVWWYLVMEGETTIFEKGI